MLKVTNLLFSNFLFQMAVDLTLGIYVFIQSTIHQKIIRNGTFRLIGRMEPQTQQRCGGVCVCLMAGPGCYGTSEVCELSVVVRSSTVTLG